MVVAVEELDPAAAPSASLFLLPQHFSWRILERVHVDSLAGHIQVWGAVPDSCLPLPVHAIERKRLERWLQSVLPQ